MKRSVIGIALSSVLFISGCVTNESDGVKKSSDEEPRSVFAASAKNFTQRSCKFVPTAKTVLEILDLGIPNLSKAAAIAAAICKAVDEGQKGGTVPRVHGVAVSGQFL